MNGWGSRDAAETVEERARVVSITLNLKQPVSPSGDVHIVAPVPGNSTTQIPDASETRKRRIKKEGQEIK